MVAILATVAEEGYTRYVVTENTKVFQIDSYLEGKINKVEVLGSHNLKYTETFQNLGFIRTLNKTTIHFVDGVSVFEMKEIPAKPFQKLTIDEHLNTRFCA